MKRHLKTKIKMALVGFMEIDPFQAREELLPNYECINDCFQPNVTRYVSEFKGLHTPYLRHNLRSLFQSLTNRSNYTSFRSDLMLGIKFHHDTYCTISFFP